MQPAGTRRECRLQEHEPSHITSQKGLQDFLGRCVVLSPIGVRSFCCCLDSQGGEGERSMMGFKSMYLANPTSSRPGWFND